VIGDRTWTNTSEPGQLKGGVVLLRVLDAGGRV
jgi:hypothetical protein